MSEERYCQSCAMPLRSAEDLGTNADGSPSEDYCVHCYKDGAYTYESTMEEMIAMSFPYVKEYHKDNPSFDADKALADMQSYFPELKRWKK